VGTFSESSYLIHTKSQVGIVIVLCINCKQIVPDMYWH